MGCVQKHNKRVPANYSTSIMFGGGSDACADITTNGLNKQLELAVGAILATLAEHSLIMRIRKQWREGGDCSVLFCIYFRL